MRIGKGLQMDINIMAVFFTAWGTPLTFLEFFAFLTSVIGVGLGVFGPRSTWPWWSIGSVLYLVAFYEWKLYASAALQLIFIAGGIWGWFGWGKEGARPTKLAQRTRLYWGAAFILAYFIIEPLLKKIGAVSTQIEAFGFIGSCLAQFWMIIQKYEAWPLWFVVDVAYTYQYWKQGHSLTAILYFIFVLIAVAGWKRWHQQSHAQ